MAEHITLPQNNDLGRLARAVVDTGSTFRDQLDRLANALETRLETGPDYSLIETDMSLSAGVGVEVYTMIVGAKNAMNEIGATDADLAYATHKLAEMLRRLGI